MRAEHLLLLCCCIRDFIYFDMHHYHILKKNEFFPQLLVGGMGISYHATAFRYSL